MKRSKLPAAIALTFLIFLSGLVAVPFLAVAAGGGSDSGGTSLQPAGTPSGAEDETSPTAPEPRDDRLTYYRQGDYFVVESIAPDGTTTTAREPVAEGVPTQSPPPSSTT